MRMLGLMRQTIHIMALVKTNFFHTVPGEKRNFEKLLIPLYVI